MTFEQNFSMLFSDIDIPEVFFTEYLCMANGDYVKVYLYLVFLCKHNSEITPLDLSKKLCLPIETVKQALTYWEENNVLIKKQKNYILNDLKMNEVNKLYHPKLTTSVEDAIQSNSKNIYRTQAINSINNTFFQGVMSPSWYTDIDLFFTKYQFDEEVMLSLFRYCFDRQALHKKYIQAVAESWASKGVKSLNDLDKYYIEYEKCSEAKKMIIKKLGLSRKLTEYEEAYVEKWILEFNYSMDVIEIALKKTTAKTNPNFNYIDKIVCDWHEHKLTTAAEINAFLKEQKEKQKTIKNLNEDTKISPIYKNDNDTQYNDLNKYYTNLKKQA